MNLKAVITYERHSSFSNISHNYSSINDSIWYCYSNFISSILLRVNIMKIKEKILDKIENVLRTIIIKYWYIDLSITIIAFMILLLIEKMKKNKV